MSAPLPRSTGCGDLLDARAGAASPVCERHVIRDGVLWHATLWRTHLRPDAGTLHPRPGTGRSSWRVEQ